MGKRKNIYISDPQSFSILCKDTLALWYLKYKDYPTQSQLIVKALTLLNNELRQDNDVKELTSSIKLTD